MEVSARDFRGLHDELTLPVEADPKAERDVKQERDVDGQVRCNLEQPLKPRALVRVEVVVEGGLERHKEGGERVAKVHVAEPRLAEASLGVEHWEPRTPMHVIARDVDKSPQQS